jgi:hypothetical protein
LREPVEASPPRIRWSLQLNHFTVEGENLMAVTMRDTDKVAVAISVVDAKGNLAKLDGIPEWSVSDPAGLALTAAEDGLSCSIAAVGPLGTFQATVTCDADLGEGVKPLIGILDLEIVAGEAVAVNFQVGTPEPA